VIRLSPLDASILARLIQYDNLERAQRLEMLTEASPIAQEIGRVLLDIEKSPSADVNETADAMRHWVQTNRAHRTARSA
jgi:hypothetical protein